MFDAHVITAERNLQQALGHSWSHAQAAALLRDAGERRHHRLVVRRDTFLRVA